MMMCEEEVSESYSHVFLELACIFIHKKNYKKKIANETPRV